jgi:HK97 family phage prohead protease/HK97 family phage major capsid protein
MERTLHASVRKAKDGGIEFVISDGSMDRHGTRINPKGWVLDKFKKNPIALFGHSSSFIVGSWSNLRQEGDELIAKYNPAQKGTSPRIDEINSLVEQDILRATSVGFEPLEYGQAGKSKYDYEKQELIEVSLVAVPSNTNALALARSMNVSDETLSLVFGEQAGETRDVPTNGKHADKRTQSQKGKTVKTLAQRIEDAQTKYDTARTAYQDHVAQEDYDMEQAETLKGEMEAREERLNSLKTAETSLAGKVGGQSIRKKEGEEDAGKGKRRPLGMRENEPKPGDLIIRAAVCSVLAMVTQRDAIKVLEERYGDHEATNIFVRAAVDPGKTTVSGWASELIETETVAFLETLRDVSFFPRLAAMGTNLQFGPGRGALKIPSRSSTPSISGSFVAEGSPIPVRRLGLTSKTLSPHKMGVISYFTRELAKYSNPQIEGLLRKEIQGDTADTLDTLLIDATVGSTTRPAGLLYGIAALTASTGNGWEAIMEDIETLATPFDTAKAGRQLVLLMNKREARKLSFVPGPNKEMGTAREFLEEAGITPIASVNVPAGRLIMLDAADFAAAAGDQPEFDVSEQTVIHAEDTSPAQISTAGSPNTVAAPAISMFQTASIALRMLLDVTWAMRRDGMVQWIDGADWSYTSGE